MTFAEASAEFLEYLRQSDSSSFSIDPFRRERARHAQQNLARYSSSGAGTHQLTAAGMRDFLARWYVEQSFTAGSEKPDRDAVTLMDSLGEFFEWADRRGVIVCAPRILQVLAELRQTIPRALVVARELSTWVAHRRGAFSFPEFLTSFEQGGRSQYDIDTPGEIGSLEGYFRIIRFEGSLAEAEELISCERVRPIVFPGEFASTLDAECIINLQLVRIPDGWEIVESGAVYPPGTEIFPEE